MKKKTSSMKEKIAGSKHAGNSKEITYKQAFDKFKDYTFTSTPYALTTLKNRTKETQDWLERKGTSENKNFVAAVWRGLNDGNKLGSITITTPDAEYTVNDVTEKQYDKFYETLKGADGEMKKGGKLSMSEKLAMAKGGKAKRKKPAIQNPQWKAEMRKGGKAKGNTIEGYLPVFPGFYNTLFQADEEQVIEDPYTYDDYDFDYKQYHQDVAKEAVEVVEKWLKDFDIKIKYQDLISPREYNFGNDSINVEYTIGKDTIKKMLAYLSDNKEAFAKYTKDRYTSRDGFSSFYSNDAEDWIKYLKDGYKPEHTFGSVLEFILENEGHDQEDLYYPVSERVYLNATLKEGVEKKEGEEMKKGGKIPTWEYTSGMEWSPNQVLALLSDKAKEKYGKELDHEDKVALMTEAKERVKHGLDIDSIYEMLKDYFPNEMKKGGKIWKALDFENIEQYYDYIHESKVNGQHQQVRDLVNKMDDTQKRNFFTYARQNGYDETINWINEKMAKGGSTMAGGGITLSWKIFKENGIDLGKYVRNQRGERGGEEADYNAVQRRVREDKSYLAPILIKMGLNSMVEQKGYDNDKNPIYNLDKFAGYIHDKFGMGTSHPNLRVNNYEYGGSIPKDVKYETSYTKIKAQF